MIQPKSNLLSLACVLLALVLAACAAKPSGEPLPPDIAYGQDACDECGMLISEPRFAAATQLTSGDYLRFDDCGEMLAYHMDHPEAQVQTWFVHDYNTEEWIRGEQAYFVKSSLPTPMGTGIVAFAKQSDAEQFAVENNGKVYRLDELRVEVHLNVHG